MLVGCVKQRKRWQGVVVVGEMVDPPHRPDFTVLFESPWRDKRSDALDLAMVEMFVLYQQRYGWKHPDDPTRTMFDLPPGGTVVTLAAA